MGPPRSAPVNRHDSGYVSLDQLAMSRLATPEEFRRSTGSQASPVSEHFSGDNRIPFGRTRAPKNVMFRDIRDVDIVADGHRGHVSWTQDVISLCCLIDSYGVRS